MSKINEEDYETLKSKFFKDYTKNPRTGNRVIYGKKPYLMLVNEFGDPEKKEIKKKKEKGKKKIEKKKIKNEEKTNILSVINVDNNIDILLQLKYNDIKNVCLVNKNYKNICEMKEFWKRLIEKDFPYILFYEKIYNNLILNKELYEKLLNEHNSTVLSIIKDFIIVTEFYDNLQELYNNINKKLIIYLENVNQSDNKDDKNAIIKLDNIFIDQIFNLLHVKINNNAKTLDKVELKYKSENNKWLKMAEILWFFRKNIDLLI